MSPAKVGEILKAADGGDTSRQFELWEKVEQDPRISRLYTRRRQAVLANPLSITAKDDADGKAVEAADFCKAALFGGEWRKRQLAGVANLDDGLFDLTDAIGKGLAVLAPEWEADDALVLPVRFNQWPQSQFLLGDPSKYMAQDCDEIRVVTDDEWNGKRIDDFAPGTWLVHTQKTFSQPLARAAMFRSVTWYYLFKTFGMGDWSILLERYGIPPRKGTYPKSADDKELAELWQALISMGKDHAAMIPDGSTIELIEQTGRGSTAPHPALIKHCNDEIAVAIAGNTMAVDQGDRGARSAKEAFQAEDLVQAKFDANGRGQGSAGGLAGSLRHGLITPLVRFNLGEDYPIPQVVFDLDDLEDLGERIKLDAEAQRMGYPLTVGYMANKYYDGEIPDGMKSDDLLETSQSATAAALSLDDPAVVQALAEGASKKKSMSWVLSTLQSKEG